MVEIELTKDEFMDLVTYNLITIVRNGDVIRIWYDVIKEGGEKDGYQGNYD